MAKGPMTVTGFIAYAQGWGGLYIRANKLAWRLIDAHPGVGIKNRFGIPDVPERVHWEEDFALEVGAPGAYDYGPERCSWLTHQLTNWMGDDGFLRRAECKVRRHNPEGDLLFIKGQVKRKFVEDGRHLVEITQEGRNQDDEQSVVGSGIVELPSRKLTMGALDGVRVVDLSRVLAGPLCTQMLADHGADVIKVEPPMGDETRLFGPPFDEAGDAAYFTALNRGKRALSLDLSKPEARAVLDKLLADADVLVENFLPGTMEKWGLGYDDARAAPSASHLLRHFRLRRRRPARRTAGLRRGVAGDVRAHERERLRRNPERCGWAFRLSITSPDTWR